MQGNAPPDGSPVRHRPAANAGPPPDWARDLMTVARAVHLADRRVPRDQEPTGGPAGSICRFRCWRPSGGTAQVPHDLVPVLNRGRHELTSMVEYSLPSAILRSLVRGAQL